MRRIILLIVTLLFISLFIFYLIWLYTRPQTSTIVIPSPTTQPQDQTETISPTPMNEISVTGVISQVSTVSYKNSTLIEVNGTNIYVTEESEIRDAEGKTITVSELKTDTAVSVFGIPAEGGIEATRVIVISQASITPTRNLSPTITP